MTIEQARADEDVIKYEFVVVQGDVVASTQPAGQIVEQSPESGMNAQKGATITVSVSGGSSGEQGVPEVEGGTMPNLENKDQRVAISLLESQGIASANIIIQEEHSDEYTKGYVISQTPEPGTDLTGVTQVTLVVSLGPEVKQVNVISYLRMTLEERRRPPQSRVW